MIHVIYHVKWWLIFIFSQNKLLISLSFFYHDSSLLACPVFNSHHHFPKKNGGEAPTKVWTPIFHHSEIGFKRRRISYVSFHQSPWYITISNCLEIWENYATSETHPMHHYGTHYCSIMFQLSFIKSVHYQRLSRYAFSTYKACYTHSRTPIFVMNYARHESVKSLFMQCIYNKCNKC